MVKRNVGANVPGSSLVGQASFFPCLFPSFSKAFFPLLMIIRPRAWVSSTFLQVTLDPLQWCSNRLLAKKNKRTARRLVQNSMSDDLGVIPGVMS